MFNSNQINKISIFSIEAGEIAKDFFRKKNFTIQKKPDGSSVTSADIEVSNFLSRNLSKEFDSIPIICEEGKLKETKEDVFFLIDPIDGTKNFIDGSVEFSVNISLIKNKKPIFGLIYAPLFRDGKIMFSNEKNQILSGSNLNDLQILKKDNFVKNDQLRIAISKSDDEDKIKQYLQRIYPNIKQKIILKKFSSTIKFILLLENEIDIYFRITKSMKWDVSAGHCLVNIMGGEARTLYFKGEECIIGNDILYNNSNFCNEPFLAKIKDFL